VYVRLAISNGYATMAEPCNVKMPMMEPYGSKADHFRCIRIYKHTGMHQWKDEKGRRTEWTGGAA